MERDDCAWLERVNIPLCLSLPSSWCHHVLAKRLLWVAACPARGTNTLMWF